MTEECVLKQPAGTVTIPPLVIAVRADGSGVNVQGPLQDKFLCWKMLTDAAQAILAYQQPHVIVPEMKVSGDILRGQG